MNDNLSLENQKNEDLERKRRWTLVLGSEKQNNGTESTDENEVRLSEIDQRIDAALSMLYSNHQGSGTKGGLGSSAPRVARWLGDIREFFPAQVVQVIQKDAYTHLGLKSMLTEPELLEAMEADVHLVADLMSLHGAVPQKTKDTARRVVGKVVDELMKLLAHKMKDAIRGAIDRSKKNRRPRYSEINWGRTILANLRHYQHNFRTVIPEKLIGYGRNSKRNMDLEEVMLCVDQSGSMGTSVVYSSIFAAVMASLPVVKTKFMCFDTAIVDYTDQLKDPIEVLFGVQLGGGTDINNALAYCQNKIEKPSQAHLILITDLYEGGDEIQMLERVAAIIRSGVNLIVLLALNDDGKPFYSESTAAKIAAFGAPVFGCTPQKFPDLMANALLRKDLNQWAANEGITTIRPAVS